MSLLDMMEGTQHFLRKEEIPFLKNVSEAVINFSDRQRARIQKVLSEGDQLNFQL